MSYSTLNWIICFSISDHTRPLIMLAIECHMVKIYWACSSVFIKHTFSLWCMFLYPNKECPLPLKHKQSNWSRHANFKALGHGSWMTMAPYFWNESIKKSMDFSPKSCGGHKPFMWTLIPTANSIKLTFKSCPKNNFYIHGHHYSYLPCGRKRLAVPFPTVKSPLYLT